MSYHKIIAARQKLAALVPHFDLGGAIDSGMGGAVTSGVSTLGDLASKAGGQAAGAFHQLEHPNNFHPNIPVNTFQAETPNIFTSNQYQMGQGLGVDMMGRGMGTTNSAINSLGQQAGMVNSAAGQVGTTAGQLSGIQGQQQTLANALAAQARGEGPNPAQLQYQQNVNNAMRQQAGAIASTKGINPALAARMAAEQGAAMQQGAAGQQAVLGAQQQLAAQQQLGQQQAAMAGTLGEQAGLYGQQGGLYGLGANVYGAQGALGAGQTAAGNQFYGTNTQGLGAQNQAIISASLGAQGINADTARANAANQVAGQQMQSGVAGQNAGYMTQAVGGLLNGVTSAGGKLFSSGAPAGAAPAGGVATAGSAAPAATTAAHGGEIPDKKAMSLAEALMGQGGPVPGKAKVGGDSPQNDTVPTVLSPGEIVLPRTVAQDPDAANKAAEFVEKLKAKAHPTYGHVLKARRRLKEAEAAHQACGGMAS